MSISTARLLLHPVDLDEARRILDRAPGPGETWAPDYPFDGDLAGIGAFVRATERDGEQRPFGYYQVALRTGGVAIGGIGFKGAPLAGAVEVGYGLAPSARGHGYATEGLLAVIGLARDLGVATVAADTVLQNTASQRVLEKAGFHQVRVDAGARWFEIQLGPSSAATDASGTVVPAADG